MTKNYVRSTVVSELICEFKCTRAASAVKGWERSEREKIQYCSHNLCVCVFVYDD